MEDIQSGVGPSPPSSPSPPPQLPLLDPPPPVLQDETCVDPTMSIIRNSTIPVNVDDLGPGLIVGTYIHSNGTLYQGVLLQLNRERGIPCGISFPQDYCSMIPSKSNEFNIGSYENDEPSSVQQRHTYFQISNNSQKPLRKFSRATKTPARYKHGNGKHRHRPTLCSKCKAFCDEINPPTSSIRPKNGDKKGTPGSSRKNQSKNKDHPSGDEGMENGLSTEQKTKDYAYSVVGPQGGLVENYWKRPQPTSDDLDKTPHSRKTEDKNPKSNNDTSPKSIFLSLKNISNNQGGSPTDSSELDDQPPLLELQAEAKKQNLKFCINKLRIKKRALSQSFENEEAKSKVLSSPDSTEVEFGIKDIFDSPVQQRQHAEKKRVLVRPRRSTREQNSVGKSRTKKRSSTVPARFRDDTIFTKNVFDFKKRGQPDTEGDISIKPTKESPESLPILKIIECERSESPSASPNNQPSPKLIISKIPRPSGPTSLVVKTEVATSQTPKIKISFGSSGKGEVVEIPSKPTIELNSEDQPSSSTPSKAEKKALRKAKKEAKAKRQISKEEDPSSLISVTTPNSLSIFTSNEFSSSQSSCSSPPPPLLTPISELIPPVLDEEFARIEQKCPPLIHFTNEIPQLTLNKKRKKEKKHKKLKYKARREDEVSPSPLDPC